MPRAATGIGVMVLGPMLLLASAWSGEQQPRTDAPPPSPPHDGTIPRPNTEAEGTKLIIKSAQRVRWSTKFTSEEVRRLARGDLQLILSLHAYEPPDSGNSAFAVALVSPAKKVSRTIDRFAPFPNRSFHATPQREPHRFQFDLSKNLDLLDDGRLTIEVGFDSARGSPQGGVAELTARLAEVD